jgi:methylglutaconyl-CoA hydratase
LSENTFEENLADSNHLRELFEIIHDLDKVVIAQVQGHALAGGCGLASICDFVFSVPEAKFGYTEVKIGFVPALVSVFLTSRIGETLAREMLLSAKLYTAEEAKSFHLINEVVPAEDLEKHVNDFASELVANNSGDAMKLTKQLFTINQGRTFSNALDEMARMNARARSTEDCQRGIAAFLAKEKISWK